MEKKELFELMDRFARSGMQRMRLEEGDFRLELEKPAPVVAVPSAVPSARSAGHCADMRQGRTALRSCRWDGVTRSKASDMG